MRSEEITLEGRKYNFDYREQPNRTVIVISSSEPWNEQDAAAIMRLSQSLSQRLLVDSNPKLPRMLFVQKIGANGNPVSVPIEELKAIVKTCLERL